jgi:hypothetical protein
MPIQLHKSKLLQAMEEAMSERQSYKWENTQYLLEVIMKQLQITQEDLENEPSWIKSKVRDLNIEKVLTEIN